MDPNLQFSDIWREMRRARESEKRLLKACRRLVATGHPCHRECPADRSFSADCVCGMADVRAAISNAEKGEG